MNTVDLNYFEAAYQRIFGKPLIGNKKTNIFAIIKSFDKSDIMKSLRWLAYVLATSMHESNDTFAPVVEGYWIKPESKRVNALYNYYAAHNPGALSTIFPNGRHGTAYYGRGRVVQLTHDFNYKAMSRAIYRDGEVLINNPDLIITDTELDMNVTFIGMVKGLFTGYRLEQFFPLGTSKANWVGARKIINGLDKANLIAGYAKKFYDCLEYEAESERGLHVVTEEEVPVDSDKASAEEKETIAEAEGTMQLLNSFAPAESNDKDINVT